MPGDSFLSKVTPGNWLTFGTVIISAVASWQWMSFQLQDQQKALGTVQTTISEMGKKIDDARTNASDQIRLVSDALGRRIDLLGDRTNTTSNDVTALKTEVSNLKDVVGELRRQVAYQRFGANPNSNFNIPGVGSTR